jgi:hypothetical protein
MSGLVEDLRSALCQIRKSHGFTLTALLAHIFGIDALRNE